MTDVGLQFPSEPDTPGVYVVHPAATCVQCGSPRPELAVMHGDPFCQTRCARAWHGCPLDPATERPERQAA